jgi:hypothetical protein
MNGCVVNVEKYHLSHWMEDHNRYFARRLASLNDARTRLCPKQKDSYAAGDASAEE